MNIEKYLNIEKIAFKVVQMKFLAMHITNQKLSFYIFTEENLGIKGNCIILTHTLYCWLLLQICVLCYL